MSGGWRDSHRGKLAHWVYLYGAPGKRMAPMMGRPRTACGRVIDYDTANPELPRCPKCSAKVGDS